MERKENMKSGVMVVGAENPSSYHEAPRSDVPLGQTVVSSTGVLTPVSVGMSEGTEKKKRGRPRKYSPDGSATRVLSPVPLQSSAPPSVSSQTSGKRRRGKSAASIAKQEPSTEIVPIGEGFERTDCANFTPHVITVNAGEDITAKLISFCQEGPRAICILSASGMVSSATLRQSDSSGGTLTYEGRFEIVNLCGSYTPTEREGTRYRAGGLSVSLSSPNGQVVGGTIAGLLIAASFVQIIVGSFLTSMPHQLKPKKPKVQSTPTPTPTTPSPFSITAPPPPPTVDKEACNGQGHNPSSLHLMPNLSSPPSYQRENWPMQQRRVSTTDINISLPGGMQ